MSGFGAGNSLLLMFLNSNMAIFGILGSHDTAYRRAESRLYGRPASGITRKASTMLTAARLARALRVPAGEGTHPVIVPQVRRWAPTVSDEARLMAELIEARAAGDVARVTSIQSSLNRLVA